VIAKILCVFCASSEIVRNLKGKTNKNFLSSKRILNFAGFPSDQFLLDVGKT